MGRKIPAKKHRGVKDPLEQQARRFQSIKGKINAPPKDPDEQPVPRSLTRLFSFQDKDKNIKKNQKSKQAQSQRDGGLASGAGPNPVARLKKLPGETGRGFSLRINSAIRALHDPTEQDYPQDMEAEDVKGSQMEAQRARRQRKQQRAARAAGGGSGGGGGGVGGGDKLTRGQKLTLKKNAKKIKVAEEARAEVQYERVAFGDVAHAPPALAAPRRAPPRPAPRPGRRELLLTALLPPGARAAAPAVAAAAPADALRRERARLDAVAAYRLLKKQRLQRRAAPGNKSKRALNQC